MNEDNVDGAPEAEATAETPSGSSKRRSGGKKRPFRTRRGLAGFLVVLFSISLFATVLSVWVPDRSSTPTSSCRISARPLRTPTSKRASRTM